MAKKVAVTTVPVTTSKARKHASSAPRSSKGTATPVSPPKAKQPKPLACTQCGIVHPQAAVSPPAAVLVLVTVQVVGTPCSQAGCMGKIAPAQLGGKYGRLLSSLRTLGLIAREDTTLTTKGLESLSEFIETGKLPEELRGI